MARLPATDVQGMHMIAEALRPVIAYSLPLGLFTQRDMDKFAVLMTRGGKGSMWSRGWN